MKLELKLRCCKVCNCCQRFRNDLFVDAHSFTEPRACDGWKVHPMDPLARSPKRYGRKRDLSRHTHAFVACTGVRRPEQQMSLSKPMLAGGALHYRRLNQSLAS